MIKETIETLKAAIDCLQDEVDSLSGTVAPIGVWIVRRKNRSPQRCSIKSKPKGKKPIVKAVSMTEDEAEKLELQIQTANRIRLLHECIATLTETVFRLQKEVDRSLSIDSNPRHH